MNKPKLGNQLFLSLLMASFVFFLSTSIANANPPGITLTSVNSAGTQTEVYHIGEAMCISGSGFTPLTTYDVYVTNDVTWTDGLTIPSRIAGTVSSLTTDATGGFQAFVVWSSAQAGVSDIVIDMNGDGIYNVDVDAIDENHTTGNFFVVAEYPLYGLLAIGTCFAAFAIFKRANKKLRRN
jgi:hypothetical protein